jgi:hypothetical protein
VGEGDVKGYQADIGPGWWGKLYEEHGREIISAKSGEPFVKVDDWNEYEVVAVGSKIKSQTQATASRASSAAISSSRRRRLAAPAQRCP